MPIDEQKFPNKGVHTREAVAAFVIEHIGTMPMEDQYAWVKGVIKADGPMALTDGFRTWMSTNRAWLADRVGA